MISDFVGAGIEGTLDFTQEKEFQGDPGKVFLPGFFPSLQLWSTLEWESSRRKSFLRTRRKHRSPLPIPEIHEFPVRKSWSCKLKPTSLNQGKEQMFARFWSWFSKGIPGLDPSFRFRVFWINIWLGWDTCISQVLFASCIFKKGEEELDCSR